MSKIYVQLGYPKTATTTLQKYFLPMARESEFLGKYDGNKNPFKYLWIKTALIDCFHLSAHEFSEKYQEFDINLDASKDYIISEELLTFDLFRPSSWQSNRPNPTAIFLNVKYLFERNGFSVSPFIVVRPQVEMITSIYAQSYVDCFSRIEKYNTFDKYLHEFFEGEDRLCEFLDYFTIVNLIEDIFGKVKVFNYEVLKFDSKVFINELNIYLGEGILQNNLPMENYRGRSNKGKAVNSKTVGSWLADLKYRIPMLRRFRHPVLRKILDKIVIGNNNSISSSISIGDRDKELIKEFYKKSNNGLACKYSVYLDNQPPMSGSN